MCFHIELSPMICGGPDHNSSKVARKCIRISKRRQRFEETQNDVPQKILILADLAFLPEREDDWPKSANDLLNGARRFRGLGPRQSSDQIGYRRGPPRFGRIRGLWRVA